MFEAIVGVALLLSFGAFIAHKLRWLLPALAFLILALLCSPL
jgi:hypothetical protein